MATPEWNTGLTDADFRTAMLGALRLLGVLAVVVMAGFWWGNGWQGGLLVLVGAVISGWSLWEWLRLVTAMNVQMDGGRDAKPMWPVLMGFVLRLGLTLVALYASLRYLHGTVFALAAGLGLGVVALTVEALRLMKRWTV